MVDYLECWVYSNGDSLHWHTALYPTGHGSVHPVITHTPTWSNDSNTALKGDPAVLSIAQLDQDVQEHLTLQEGFILFITISHQLAARGIRAVGHEGRICCLLHYHGMSGLVPMDKGQVDTGAYIYMKIWHSLILAMRCLHQISEQQGVMLWHRCCWLSIDQVVWRLPWQSIRYIFVVIVFSHTTATMNITIILSCLVDLVPHIKGTGKLNQAFLFSLSSFSAGLPRLPSWYRWLNPLYLVYWGRAEPTYL